MGDFACSSKLYAWACHREIDNATKGVGVNEDEDDILNSLKAHASSVIESDLMETEQELELAQVCSRDARTWRLAFLLGKAAYIAARIRMIEYSCNHYAHDSC